MKGASGTETIVALAAFSLFFLLFVYIYVSGISVSSAAFGAGSKLLENQLLLQQASILYLSSGVDSLAHLNISNTILITRVGADFNGTYGEYGRFTVIGNHTYYIWVNE